MSPLSPEESPIHALAQRLHQDQAASRHHLERFVTEHTFPLTRGGRATYFWWDGEPLDQLFLLHWINGLESRVPFQRIPNTHAWFVSVDYPPAGRIEYKLELHREGTRRLVRDPLNPRLARDPFGANSVCPMPAYAEPPWARPEADARPGSLEALTVESAAFGDRREVQVYLPSEYKAHKRYPLLVCHDGRDYLRYAGMKTVLDNLVGRKEVLPLIVAFTSGSAERNVEYGANPRQVDFLCDELLPALEARYGVTRDPGERALMGASFGGVSTLYTAWRRPGVFTRLLLQSGSLVFTDVGQHGRGPLWDPVVDFVNALREDPGPLLEPVPHRIFMSCGIFEGLIRYNRALAPELRAAGLRVRFVESADGHNWVAWRDRLREGLSWLLPGHLWMTYE